MINILIIIYSLLNTLLAATVIGFGYTNFLQPLGLPGIPYWNLVGIILVANAFLTPVSILSVDSDKNDHMYRISNGFAYTLCLLFGWLWMYLVTLAM
jgi:hypothetical protein